MLFITVNSSAQEFQRYRKLKDTTYQSADLGYSRHLEITVPVEYQDNLPQNFPLIVIFDAQNKRNYHYILQTIDYLTANEQIPAAVIVGVEAGQNNRRYLETQLKISDSSGTAEKNEADIFSKLIPLTKKSFKASDYVLLIGHSRYGFFTSYLLAKHPEQLNAVISISPFLQQPNINLAEILPAGIGKTQLKHAVYYRFAMGNDYPEDYRKLSAVIKSADFNNPNINADGWLFADADHLSTPGLAIARSLYEVFGYWSVCQKKYLDDKNKKENSIDTLKKQITIHYGVSIPFSIGILNGKGYSFYNAGDYASAILAWQQLVNQYPNFSNGYLNIAKCQQKLQQQNTGTIVAFKKSLAQSVIFSEDQKKDLLKEIDKYKYPVL